MTMRVAEVDESSNPVQRSFTVAPLGREDTGGRA